MEILFVCSGNTCRSAMAQTLARDWLKRHGVGMRVRVFSAGISAYTGEEATDGAKERHAHARPVAGYPPCADADAPRSLTAADLCCA